MRERIGFWSVLDLRFFAFGLWLVAALPISYAGGGADDALFVRLALALLSGHWLGPFDSDTLIKPPFYPMFLAACAAAHLPIRMATQAVALGAGLLAGRVAGRLLGSRGAATVCFALLALNPAPLDVTASMLLREPLYAGLLLLVLAMAARLWLLRLRRPRCEAVLLGLAFAAFWLTREEGALLLPSLALLAGWRVWHDRSRALIPIGVAAMSAAVPLLVVAGLNWHSYGEFRLTDAASGPVMSAYGALARIRHPRRLDAPIPRGSFAAAFAVSPTTRRLEPYLDGAGRRFWVRASCENEPPGACDDIRAGWILWALRAAVTEAGAYATARRADKFYQRMAGEIDRACDSGRLRCEALRRSLLPQLRWSDLPVIAADTWRVARDEARLGPTRPAILASLVPPSDYAPYERIAPTTPAAPPRGAGSLTWKLPVHPRVAALLASALSVLSAATLPIALAWVIGRVAVDLGRRRITAATAFAGTVALALVVRTAFLGLAAATLVPMQYRYLAPGFPLELLLIGWFASDVAIGLGAALVHQDKRGGGPRSDASGAGRPPVLRQGCKSATRAPIHRSGVDNANDSQYHRQAIEGTDMSRTALPLAATLAIALSGAAWADAPLRFVLKDHRLSPSSLIVPADTRFRIEVVNQDSTTDEFESYDLRVEKIVVPGGTIRVMAGPLHPGTYKVFDDYHPDTANGTVTAVAGK